MGARRSWRARSTGGRVAVIGAGPYGLAVAAHLRAAGVETRCFGEPLEFWRRHMPAGMLLRSRKRSTHIAFPDRSLTIDRYEQASGKTVRTPSLRLSEFIDYALWYQQTVVPEIDPRRVVTVVRDGARFRLVLDDGDELEFARVVVAAGLAPFAVRPQPFASLPEPLVSHSSDHVDLGVFAGKRVLVIGGGQSALESAALLHEQGADVEVLSRTVAIYWLPDGGANGGRSAGRKLVPIPPPPTDVGGRLSGWTAAAPDVFRRLPGGAREWVSYRCIRPAGSGWLAPRLQQVAISCGRRVVLAEAHRGRVRVVLDDGSERIADHVLLGTGYAIDVRRYAFLPPELTFQIRLSGGYPILGPGLESSIPGLHFVGAPAALTFGPVMRFVVGAWYSAPAVTRMVLGQPQPPIRFSF